MLLTVAGYLIVIFCRILLVGQANEGLRLPLICCHFKLGYDLLLVYLLVVIRAVMFLDNVRCS